MAVSYVWPGNLPQAPLADGYAETDGALIERVPMDKGPGKVLLRGERAEPLEVALLMTDAQLATLRAFVLTTLRRVARFGFPHPTRGVQVEVRLRPGGDGDLIVAQRLAANRWRVALRLEILP